MGQTPDVVRSTRRRVATAIGGFLCVLLIPILVMNLTIIVQSFIAPERVPGFLGYKPLIVLSGSMQPFIDPGDIVVVKEVPAESLTKGDVIAYLRSDSIVTHRIMEIDAAGDNRKFYTKGDNNNVDDGLAVTANMLQGKYLFRIPRAGHAAIFMQTPAGMAVVVALPLMLFIAYDFLARRHHDKKEALQTRQLEEELAAIKRRLAEAEASGKKGSDEEATHKAGDDNEDLSQ